MSFIVRLWKPHQFGHSRLNPITSDQNLYRDEVQEAGASLRNKSTCFEEKEIASGGSLLASVSNRTLLSTARTS
ncbi:hypothetical protein K7X08_006048 [Anisodus acutangulus]|uniref:Uncharacterized protein n=1 Tax=Anisodus acutangulus TaxID=402998 RepID=A0A9Q1LUF1_9SOLA|nr:hypothetical protein K7X08_006048 [Anisodus acutangulus]